MTLSPSFTLDSLVDTYRRAVHAPGAHSTPEHAGLAAVLELITDEARYAIARTPERYDHRSLYEFTAALDYALRPAHIPEPNIEALHMPVSIH